MTKLLTLSSVAVALFSTKTASTDFFEVSSRKENSRICLPDRGTKATLQTRFYDDEISTYEKTLKKACETSQAFAARPEFADMGLEEDCSFRAMTRKACSKVQEIFKEMNECNGLKDEAAIKCANVGRSILTYDQDLVDQGENSKYMFSQDVWKIAEGPRLVYVSDIGKCCKQAKLDEAKTKNPAVKANNQAKPAASVQKVTQPKQQTSKKIN